MSDSKEEKRRNLTKDFLAGRIDRRTFIIAASALAGGFALSAWLPSIFKSSVNDAPLNEAQIEFIETVQQHLFPKEADSPGAADINAGVYLQFVLADPNVDSDDRQLLIDGIGRLEQVCQKEFTQTFKTLNYLQKESALRKIEQESWGERWLSLLLLYIFEALLTDPVYGGNPGGIGWEWLGHVQGQPQPKKVNMYGAH
jgi:gluconate 2-dehydrogenase gamma chain